MSNLQIMREQKIKQFSSLTEEIKGYSLFTNGLNALTKTSVNIPFGENLLLNWKIRAKNHISNTCGRHSIHYEEFEKAEEYIDETDIAEATRILLAVFTAAEKDFKEGNAPSVRLIAQSDVFMDELDLAQELLDRNHGAAAVIACIVLETKLRQMCTVRSLPDEKLDRMNSDLVKSEAYDTNTQKRITAIAGIRNSAAHGKAYEISKPDVQGIIDDVRRFIEKQID